MLKETQGLEAQRTKCEVYSRVVGYIRPVQQWNDGKQAEYDDRKEFSVKDCE
jgi:ribonucleoside-triphosphate reductase